MAIKQEENIAPAWAGTVDRAIWIVLIGVVALYFITSFQRKGKDGEK